MSKKEMDDRAKHNEAIGKRRTMVKGVEDFYNQIPEERRNPDHKECFEALLGLMVNDRSEKPSEKPKWITGDNLLLIGFKEATHDLGTMYIRGDIKIVPDNIMNARRQDWGEYQIEKYRDTLRDIEIEIRKKLKRAK